MVAIDAERELARRMRLHLGHDGLKDWRHLRECRQRSAVSLRQHQGRERFGAPDEATRTALNGVSDLDRLKRMARRLLRANSWEELLRTR